MELFELGGRELLPAVSGRLLGARVLGRRCLRPLPLQHHPALLLLLLLLVLHVAVQPDVFLRYAVDRFCFFLSPSPSLMSCKKITEISDYGGLWRAPIHFGPFPSDQLHTPIKIETFID